MTQFYRLWHWWLALSGRDRAIIILEAAGVVVVAVYTTVAALQWCTLREANKEARKAFMAAQRAWIGIDAVDVERTYFGKLGPNDVQFTTTLVAKNFGNSLATDITMNVDFAADERQLAMIADTVCWSSSPLPSPAVQHVTIFPNKVAPYRIGGSLPAERIKILNSRPLPFMVGCFTYGDPYIECRGKRTCHWTRFCYQERYEPDIAAKIQYDLWKDYNDAD